MHEEGVAENHHGEAGDERERVAPRNRGRSQSPAVRAWSMTGKGAGRSIVFGKQVTDITFRQCPRFSRRGFQPVHKAAVHREGDSPRAETGKMPVLQAAKIARTRRFVLEKLFEYEYNARGFAAPAKLCRVCDPSTTWSRLEDSAPRRSALTGREGGAGESRFLRNEAKLAGVRLHLM